MAFVAIVGALACINMAAGFYLPPPHGPIPKPPSGCPKPPLPEIKPIIVEQVAPAPITVGLPLTPAVIEHHSAPYEINYFGKPYIIKHHQSAALNVLTQTPVVVDSFAPPTVNEAAAPPAVIVEEVCPPLPAPAPASAPISAPYPGQGPAPYPCH